MLKRWVIILCLLGIWNHASAKENCYVLVDKSGSYESLTVSAISITLIRQFIEDVQIIPGSGISDKEKCIYQVTVVDEREELKVFLFGPKISDYGKSKLRGEAALEQATLRAIYKSTNDQSTKDKICQKYGKALTYECQGKTTATVSKPKEKETSLTPLMETSIAPEPPNDDRPKPRDEPNRRKKPVDKEFRQDVKRCVQKIKRNKKLKRELGSIEAIRDVCRKRVRARLEENRMVPDHRKQEIKNCVREETRKEKRKARNNPRRRPLTRSEIVEWCLENPPR